MTSKSIVYKIIKYELNTAIVQGTIIHEFSLWLDLSEDLEHIAVSICMDIKLILILLWIIAMFIDFSDTL
jgi:hypothetical protein